MRLAFYESLSNSLGSATRLSDYPPALTAVIRHRNGFAAGDERVLSSSQSDLIPLGSVLITLEFSLEGENWPWLFRSQRQTSIQPLEQAVLLILGALASSVQ